MKVDVQLYGKLAALAGRSITIDAPNGGCTVGELRELIAAQWPSLAGVIDPPENRAFVDDRMVGETLLLDAGATVEFLPPVSGG